jgi:hypothetical protein
MMDATRGKSTSEAVAEVQAAADTTKAQYQQYLDSGHVMVDPDIVAGPTKP